jgi:hypothetical protein
MEFLAAVVTELDDDELRSEVLRVLRRMDRQLALLERRVEQLERRDADREIA